MTAQSSTLLKVGVAPKQKIKSATIINIIDTVPVRDADPADAIQVGKGTAGDKTVFFKTDTADASIHYDDVDDRFEFDKSITLGTLVVKSISHPFRRGAELAKQILEKLA